MKFFKSPKKKVLTTGIAVSLFFREASQATPLQSPGGKPHPWTLPPPPSRFLRPAPPLSTAGYDIEAAKS